MRTTEKFVFFWGNREIYSNFYKKPFFYKGVKIPCSEVGFMMEKAIQFNDTDILNKLKTAHNPARAKELGRKIKNYDDAVWNEVRYDRMKEVLIAKFSDPALKKQLKDTGKRTLVEASPMDKIWGIGMDENHPQVEDISKWKGQNLLGQVLMDIRDGF